MFDSSKFSALFLQWIGMLSNVVLVFGAWIPCSVSVLWLVTKVGSPQRWSLFKAISLSLALLGPVVCLVCLTTFSSIRHLVTLIPNTGNFITDSPDGYHFANSAVMNADVALVLNTTFFLFYNMFSGFSGLFLGAAISLTCYFPVWSRKVHICCRVRVVLRVVCFIVCPIVQIMICMHPLILWCQDTGEGIQLLWDFIFTWMLPVGFGLILDQIVLSAAFEALCRSKKMLANSMPQKVENLIFSIKYVRNVLNYVSALTIYCVGTIIVIQVCFLYAMWYLFEDIVDINSNYILPDSGNFVRATMGSTFVVCCLASQICFRALLLPEEEKPALIAKSRFNDAADEQTLESSTSHASPHVHHTRSSSNSNLSDAISIPSLHSLVISPLDAARQRASSAASMSASAASGAGRGGPDSASEVVAEEAGGLNDDGEYIFQSFVQVGDNGNIYYREFSTDYTYFFFFQKLKDSLKEWIFESTEALYPEAFGWKVPYRRLSLFIGCIMVSLLLHKQVSDVAKFSAKAKIQLYLNDFGIDLQWPANGTVFDGAFVAFNDADTKQVYSMMAAVSLFWVSFAFDVLSSCIFPANLANLEMLVAGGSTGYTILRLLLAIVFWRLARTLTCWSRHKSIMLFFSRMCALLGGLLVFGMIIVSRVVCSVAVLQCFSVSVLQCYSVSVLHCCSTR